MNIKKIFLLMSGLFTIVTIQAQKDIYTVNFKGLTEKQIDMSAFRNKKIIVVICDASDPDREQLKSLDSLSESNKNKLAVIILPVTDIGGGSSGKNFEKLILDTMKLACQVAQPSRAGKQNGSEQQDLLQWLTRKENNKYFNAGIKRTGEMFMISEKGKLFARIAQKVDLGRPFMAKLLSQVVKD